MPPFEDNLDEEETRQFWPIIVIQIVQFKIYNYISGACFVVINHAHVFFVTKFFWQEEGN